MRLVLLFILFFVASAHWSEIKSPLTNAIGFNTVMRCYGRDTCASRWILCNRNWKCDFDCMGCAICGDDEETFEQEPEPDKECRGAGRCKNRVIICPPLTYCIYSKSGCPACSPYI